MNLAVSRIAETSILDSLVSLVGRRLMSDHLAIEIIHLVILVWGPHADLLELLLQAVDSHVFVLGSDHLYSLPFTILYVSLIGPVVIELIWVCNLALTVLDSRDVAAHGTLIEN